MNTWMIDELIAEQRLHTPHSAELDLVEEARLAAPRHPGLRHAVASGLVRLGVSLDRSAGERVLAPSRGDRRWEDGHGVYS